MIEKYSRQIASNGLTSNNDSVLSETTIEEKIRKKLEKEFQQLENNATLGIKQRDEAIKKRDELIKKQKREKERLAKQLKEAEAEKENENREKESELK